MRNNDIGTCVLIHQQNVETCFSYTPHTAECPMSEPKRASPLGISEIDPTAGRAVREKIHRDLNPGGGPAEGEESDGGHNRGQPRPPPHAKEGGSSAGSSAATFLTACAKEHSDSLQCIERNYQNRSACEPFFQAYKDCRREENEARKAKAAGGGNGTGGGWFW